MTEVSPFQSCFSRKYSGRVGRSAAAKRLDPEAIRLATIASVRHRFTDYDLLLLEGVDRGEARARVCTHRADSKLSCAQVLLSGLRIDTEEFVNSCYRAQRLIKK
jgi:hypothetical protein